jgi:hypothetical protein
MKIISCVTLIVTLILSNYAVAESRIVKWVDKDGVTHYGDKSPMPEAAKRSSELSKDGRIVKRIEPKNNDAAENDKRHMEQTRHDAALLASYSSDKEIDIAQERNTRIDEIALETLNQKLEGLNQQLAKNSAAEVFFIDKKKPVPDNIKHERQAVMANIAETEQQITKKKAGIEATRQRFQEDKTRYVELKAQGVSYKDLIAK